MSRALSFLVLIIFLTACKPTYEDWKREDDIVFQGYLTGNVQTAKAALLEEEKILAKHEARGNRGVDFRAVRLALYGELCGISTHRGQTNEARLYFQKYLENRTNKDMTFDDLIAASKKVDDQLKPKWREQK